MTWIVVPRPTPARMRSSPPIISTRSRMVVSPSPARRRLGRVEAGAVVDDREDDAAAPPRQVDGDLRRARVAGDVGERLLDDPVEVQLVLGGEGAAERDRREPERQAVAERECLRMRPQRRFEALTQELGRVGVIHQARDRLGDLPDGRMGRRERRAEVVDDGTRRSLERFEERVDGPDRMPDVLVELAGEAAALGVQHLEHALAELALGRFHVGPLGDVARDSEHVGLAGDLDAREAHLARKERPVLAQRADGQHHAGSGRQGRDRLPVKRQREVGIDVRDRHAGELLPGPAAELEGALVDVTEVAGSVGEKERLARHVGHLAEDGEVEGRETADAAGGLNAAATADA